MAPVAKFLLAALLAANSVVSAFSTLSTSKGLVFKSPPKKKKNAAAFRRIGSSPADMTASNEHVTRIRGGSAAGGAVVAAASASASSSDPAAKFKKVRIVAFDSMRFFLITCIVLGHFIRFAGPSDFWFKFFSHNVLVGAFLVLSGYVTAYTTTENGKREPSDKLVDTPKQQWILSRVFGYYPLHLATLLLFSPMFLYADVTYNGWPTAALNGLLSATMTQAWFPNTAEVWNAPTWFLSALTFATALMPFCLPSIAKMDKKALKKTAVWLTLASLLPKLGYLYDFKCFGIAEGWTSPKAHPNMAMFNMMRFSPLHISAEVILGAVACRYVMLDNADDDEQGSKMGPVKTNFLSTLIPLTGILAIMTARALDLVQVSDMVVRPLLFMPLFLKFLMAVHRNTVNKSVSDPLVGFLSNNVLVWLGNLAFPIFVVHGPVGQVFYKKLIATKLFGKVLEGPAYFGLYLLSTLTMAYIMQKLVLQNKAVGNWSKKAVDSLSSWM